MPIHTRLYEVLDVAPSGNPEEIKAAYRKKAAQVHPDKEGGSEEAMQEVNAAYIVLKDPEKRARYDSSGEEGSPIRESKYAHIARHLVPAFQAALTEVVQASNGDVAALMRCDLMLGTRSHLDKGLKKIKASIEETKKGILLVDTLLERLSFDASAISSGGDSGDGAEDLITGQIRMQGETLRTQLVSHEQDLVACQQAKDFSFSYSYRFEAGGIVNPGMARYSNMDDQFIEEAMKRMFRDPRFR